MLTTDQIPHSQEVEAALLGAVLQAPEYYLAVGAFLKKSDFFILRHQIIWEAISRLGDREAAIDYVTVQDELRAMGKLADVGGAAYLTHLLNGTPNTTHAEAYGRVVYYASLRRKGLQLLDEIREQLLNEELNTPNIFMEALRRLDALQPQDRERYIPGHLVTQRYFEIRERLKQRAGQGAMIGYPMPESMADLSEAMPVLFPGDFMVISGPTGSGKSALCESLAEHFGSLGLKVEYMHTEMTDEQLLHRRMARHSGIPYHLLAQGQGDEFLTVDVNREMESFAAHINLHWMPDPEFTKVKIELRRAAEAGAQIIILDHFQDLQPEAVKDANIVRAFEDMCTWLNAFAEYRKVVLIVASQETEGTGKTKWTRKLTEKAVVWLSIRRERVATEYIYGWRDKEFIANKGEDHPVSEIRINKQRFGKRAKIRMLYHGPGFLWLDMSEIKRDLKGLKVWSIEELKDRDARARASGEKDDDDPIPF